MSQMAMAFLSALAGLAPAVPLLWSARPEAVLARADDQGQAVPLGEVPEVVSKAARDAVPGLVIERAFRETEKGAVLYELQGTAGGRKVEVEVTAGGKVLEIEWEDGAATTTDPSPESRASVPRGFPKSS